MTYSNMYPRMATRCLTSIFKFHSKLLRRLLLYHRPLSTGGRPASIITNVLDRALTFIVRPTLMIGRGANNSSTIGRWSVKRRPNALLSSSIALRWKRGKRRHFGEI